MHRLSALRRARRPADAAQACAPCRGRIGAAARALLVGTLLPFVLAACNDNRLGETSAATGGNPRRGVALIARYGCGSCHAIPGIAGADGLVGPPLDRIGSRVFIAGVRRNTPASMIAWLEDPQAIVPGNAMPNMGLDEQEARDVAAYLYTLR